LLVPGEFADASIVKTGANSLRMYFSSYANADGTPTHIYSALSLNGGETWSIESGTRFSSVSGIEVIRLTDGTYKAYYQVFEDWTVIKSASSSDGLTWTVDEGIRLGVTPADRAAGIRIGFPGIAKLADGSWLMVYETELPGAFSSTSIPGDNTIDIIQYATSSDGNSWTAQGVAVDSRNDFLNGHAKHARLLETEDGVMLYFWTGGALSPPEVIPGWNDNGIYSVLYNGSSFSSARTMQLDPEPTQDKLPIIPGDPIITDVNGVLRLYYNVGPDNGPTFTGIYEARGNVSGTVSTPSQSQLLVGTHVADVLVGAGTFNSFNGYEGNDVLSGAGSRNEAVFNGPRANYHFAGTNSVTTVSDQTGSDGTDTLENIQRLHFTDTSVAIDLNGKAGEVARLLGAVFGKSSVQNKAYAGIGLRLLDDGMSFQTLAGLALQEAGLDTPDAVVTTLWTNVVGSAPSAQDKAPFLAMLDDGTTHAELAVMAATHPLNDNNINLVGLAQTGLEYI
jgi:hypothetical protein